MNICSLLFVYLSHQTINTKNMARGDKTGPMGQGPMTGRGLGYCAGYDQPGFTNNEENRQGQRRGLRQGGGYGPGFGRGYGGGMGRRRANWNANANTVTPTVNQGDSELKKRLDQLEAKLNQLLEK